MNVFLVLTPLQLINALEAKHHFATEDNVLIVLRHSSLGYPISMFKRLIDDGDWDVIYYLSTYEEEAVKRINILEWTYLSFRQRQKINKLAASLGCVEGLFIGQYHEPIARHFSNVLPYKKLYLIDDGTSTLETNDERKAPPQRFLQGNLTARLKHLFLRLNDSQAEQATFFTAYDIEPRAGDEVVANRYPHFRKRVSSISVGEEVWFLGEPLVLDGYLTEATYLAYLERIRQHYQGQHFVYLPHSREQWEDVKRIGAFLNCEIRRFGIPVEFALRNANPRPRELASFISSALPNCRIMFGNTLQYTSIYLAPEQLLAHKAFVASVYEHFGQLSDSHFRVLELEPLSSEVS